MGSFTVIQISNHGPHRKGTFECYTHELVRVVKEAGGQIHLVYFSPIPPPAWFIEWMSTAGAHVHTLPYELTEPEQPWKIAHRIRCLIPPTLQSIVHVQFPIFCGICMALRFVGYKHVILSDQLSGNVRPLSAGKHLLRRLANRLRLAPAAAITALSSHIRRRHLALGIPAKRTTVLHIGCDLSCYQPAKVEQRRALRQTYGFKDSDVVLCYVGRLMEEKGVDVFLRAASLLRDVCPEMRLLIVGGGAAESSLKTLAGEVNVSDRCVFTGRVAEPASMYQISDVMVCPSLWAEGFGYVNIEAMATGLPVVASDIGGITDAVVPGVTGLLVPPGDERQLSDALRHLIKNQELRQQMGQTGRQRVHQLFTLQHTIKMTMQLYNRVLAGNTA